MYFSFSLPAPLARNPWVMEDCRSSDSLVDKSSIASRVSCSSNLVGSIVSTLCAHATSNDQLERKSMNHEGGVSLPVMSSATARILPLCSRSRSSPLFLIPTEVVSLIGMPFLGRGLSNRVCHCPSPRRRACLKARDFRDC